MEIAGRHPDQEIAIVSHGALIKSVLCHADKLPLSELWTAPHMHNCAHSIVEFNGVDDMRIVQYADQAYQEVVAQGQSKATS